MESSRTRDWTHDSCIDGWILYWTIREVPQLSTLLLNFFLSYVSFPPPLAAFKIFSWFSAVFQWMVYIRVYGHVVGFFLKKKKNFILWVFWTWDAMFPQFWKTLAIVSSNIISATFFLSSPSGTPAICKLDLFSLSQRSFILFSVLLCLYASFWIFSSIIYLPFLLLIGLPW